MARSSGQPNLRRASIRDPLFRKAIKYVVDGFDQGTVREIGLFTTIMITRDGVYVSIPNSAIFGVTVINFTRERLRG